MATRKPPASLPEEERRIFRDAVRDVRPLPAPPEPPRPPPPPPVTQTRGRARPRAAAEVPRAPAPPEPAARRPATRGQGPGPAAGKEGAFARAGLQRRVLERLRRGRYPVAAEIDLHGCRAREALADLARFLDTVPRSAGAVCVRVIHGKGRRSPEGPVLRPLVAAWLSGRDDVLAFTSAPEHEGGSGALYVLLRRA